MISTDADVQGVDEIRFEGFYEEPYECVRALPSSLPVSCADSLRRAQGARRRPGARGSPHLRVPCRPPPLRPARHVKAGQAAVRLKRRPRRTANSFCWLIARATPQAGESAVVVRSEALGVEDAGLLAMLLLFLHPQTPGPWIPTFEQLAESVRPSLFSLAAAVV